MLNGDTFLARIDDTPGWPPRSIRAFGYLGHPGGRPRARLCLVRSLTWVEMAAIFAAAGSLLAATVPAFVENLEASRLAEPIEGLGTIAARASVLAAGQPAERAYPASVELTPAAVPRGKRILDMPGTWDQPTWQRLGFRFDRPHAFSFSFHSVNQKGYATFEARAHGDLDGDGVLSTFVVRGESRDTAQPIIFPMEIEREVE